MKVYMLIFRKPYLLHSALLYSESQYTKYLSKS